MEAKIEIPFKDITNGMVLCLEVGYGAHNGHEVEVTASAANYSPIVSYRGKRIIVPLDKIVEAVCEAIDAQLDLTGRGHGEEVDD